MLEKRRLRKGVTGSAPQDPRDMVKATLLEVQSQVMPWTSTDTTPTYSVPAYATLLK
jgi:hypothetical protein